MSSKNRGFTIVELLIVIVIIAILAAIIIVAYNGIQNRANDSAVQNDLSTIAKKIRMYRAVNDDYPKGSAQMAKLEVNVSTDSYSRGMYNGTSWYNLVYCWPNAANPDVFALVAESKSGQVFEVRNGMVQKASYGLSGSTATCANAGVTMDSGSYRDWFYDVDAWHSYAK